MYNVLLLSLEQEASMWFLREYEHDASFCRAKTFRAPPPRRSAPRPATFRLSNGALQ